MKNIKSLLLCMTLCSINVLASDNGDQASAKNEVTEETPAPFRNVEGQDSDVKETDSSASEGLLAIDSQASVEEKGPESKDSSNLGSRVVSDEDLGTHASNSQVTSDSHTDTPISTSDRSASSSISTTPTIITSQEALNQSTTTNSLTHQSCFAARVADGLDQPHIELPTKREQVQNFIVNAATGFKSTVCNGVQAIRDARGQDNGENSDFTAKFESDDSAPATQFDPEFATPLDDVKSAFNAVRNAPENVQALWATITAKAQDFRINHADQLPVTHVCSFVDKLWPFAERNASILLCRYKKEKLAGKFQFTPEEQTAIRRAHSVESIDQIIFAKEEAARKLQEEQQAAEQKLREEAKAAEQKAAQTAKLGRFW